MSLQKIGELRDALYKTIQEEGKTAIQQEFKSVFDAMPRLAAFSWTQYTPHFNDGDACEFGVNEPSFALTGLEKEGGPKWEGDDGEDEEEGLIFNDPWSFRYADKTGDAEKYNLPTVEEVDLMERVTSIVQGNEDIMQSVFDDGVRVTVYRDGRVTVNDYDHD